MKEKLLFLFCVVIANCITISLSFAADPSTGTIKQKLVSRISLEQEEIQQAQEQGMPEFASPTIAMNQKAWQKILTERQRRLDNLLTLVTNTPDEKLADVLVKSFLHKKDYAGRYPPLEPYLLLLGEGIIPAFSKQYEQAGPRLKEKVLGILGNTRSREALPIVRKALDDPNQRVMLFAQTALRLILNLEAKPELEKMLVETKSSWALKHTLNEISITGETDWFNHFFQLVKTHKISLQDMASIGNPEDCPEASIRENLDFLVNTLISDTNPRIHTADMQSLGEFLHLIQNEPKDKSAILDDVLSHLPPERLNALKKYPDVTELAGEDEDDLLVALNKTVGNLRLYPDNASKIELINPNVFNRFNALKNQRIFSKNSSGGWMVKDPLSVKEIKDVRWFNLHLLMQEFPLIVSKDIDNTNAKDVARRLLLCLNQRQDLLSLHPLLTELLRERFGWGGKTKGFSSRVERPHNRHIGFSDDETDLILQRIASKLDAEDIEKWLAQKPSDFLTISFLNDLLAQKNGGNTPPGKNQLSFKIKVMDQAQNVLAFSEFQLQQDIEQNIALPSLNEYFPEHNIKLTVQLDPDTRIFHMDPVFIDLNPHAAIFNIYVPVAGTNEIPLIETMAGKKEKTLWVFEHVDDSF